MKGYKAFNKGLICKDKQYAENTVFEEPKAIPCECGMHFCENPIEVFNYYELVNEKGEIAEFAEVESLDEPVTDGGIKYCSTKLKIHEKLSFPQFIHACVNFLLERKNNITSIMDSEDCSHFADSKRYSCITSSGNYSNIASLGKCSRLASSGDSAHINSEGEYSVICCAGNGSQVKAKKGSWITLSEWVVEGTREIPKCVKTEYVDGERIKEDTFYTLKNGKFVEVE